MPSIALDVGVTFDVVVVSEGFSVVGSAVVGSSPFSPITFNSTKTFWLASCAKIFPYTGSSAYLLA